jgi:hypothetical protein
MVEENVREMSAGEYLTFSVLAVGCATGSVRLLVTISSGLSERRGYEGLS